MCPCHGSQYNAEGKKIRGPAPLSLALAHCDIVDDLVSFTPWWVVYCFDWVYC
jgi:cytochrome b6-f complex iron-sulfur subunit